MSQGYQALREGAAWLDLDGRGRIGVAGEDNARLLHAMSTNHIQQLQPGEGCYTFFLNAQGRIVADAHVLRMDDRFLLDTEPGVHDTLYQHLDKFIIADDVTLEDMRTALAAFGIEGPRAEEVAAKARADFKVAPFSFTGGPGFRVYAPRQDRDRVVELLNGNATAATLEDAETVRLEHFHPRYGADITEKNLVHETQLLHAIHFSKGCYLGQEIVERVRSRGQVHRLLVPLYVDSRQAPAPHTPVSAAGAAVGETASSAFSPALNRSIAFAYVRAGHAQPGTALTVGDAAAEVAAAKGV